MDNVNLNKGKWDYTGISDVAYSDSEYASYKKAAEFLGDTVEDWGGGTGWARRYFENYRNVDFSSHPNVDEVADLKEYTSDVENILIRQVIDAEPQWQQILENAKKSFSKKLCLIIGTPFVRKTRLGPRDPVFLADGTETGDYYQEMYFKKQDILDMFPQDQYKLSEEIVKTKQYYHRDWILYVEKIS